MSDTGSDLNIRYSSAHKGANTCYDRLFSAAVRISKEKESACESICGEKDCGQIDTPPIRSTPNTQLYGASDLDSDAAKVSDSDSGEEDTVSVLSDSEDVTAPKVKKKITDYFTTTTITRKHDITSYLRGSKKCAPATVIESANTQQVLSLEDDSVVTVSKSLHKYTQLEDGNVPGSQKKRKPFYATYTLRQKLVVLDYTKTHSESETARHFSIPRTTLQSWKGLDKLPKDKAKAMKKGKHAKRGSGRPLSYSADTEEQIVQWVLECRDLQIPIQRKMIQCKALTLISPQNSHFRASQGWLQKFML